MLWEVLTSGLYIHFQYFYLIKDISTRMPVFPKDVFEDDYPDYNIYDEDHEDEFETEIIEAKTRKNKKH